jgi:GDPmannose 4,6-dehydratase
MNNVAIVVGDRGQDGTLIRASLEKQGIQVVGVGRDRLTLPAAFDTPLGVGFSVDNTNQVLELVNSIRPLEIYYLAAHHGSSEQSGSDNSPSEYADFHKVHVVGLLNFLWAIRSHSPNSRLFYAASSLVFSGNDGPIQSEETPFSPSGFYGLTKTQGILICREFRERFKIFTVSGILYNHESSLRADKFLSKRLISSAHRISQGLQQDLVVGNIKSETDWGYAPDYVEAFQLALRTVKSDDYVFATGESHSVAEFAQIVFDCFGLDYTKYVRECPNVLIRNLPRKIGNSSKLKTMTGWRPTHNFADMVQALVNDYLAAYDVTDFNK